MINIIIISAILAAGYLLACELKTLLMEVYNA